MMSFELVLGAAKAIERAGLEYMMVGSFVTNLYAKPRSTQDADFVVNLTVQPDRDLSKILGPDFSLDPQMAFETITFSRQLVFSHKQSPFKIEFFVLGDDEFGQSQFKRRLQAPVEDILVWVATAEDIVLNKLRWSSHASRAKDAADARNIIFWQNRRLDLAYIHTWAEKHRTRALFEKMWREEVIARGQ